MAAGSGSRAAAFAAGIWALTLLPSCSLSTPVITTTSPGTSPEVTSESSPSVVPIVIWRTVTVESGLHDIYISRLRVALYRGIRAPA